MKKSISEKVKKKKRDGERKILSVSVRYGTLRIKRNVWRPFL